MSITNRKHRGGFLNVNPSGFTNLHINRSNGRQAMGSLSYMMPIGGIRSQMQRDMNRHYGAAFSHVGKFRDYYAQGPMYVSEMERPGGVYKARLTANMSTMRGEGPSGGPINQALVQGNPSIEKVNSLIV